MYIFNEDEVLDNLHIKIKAIQKAVHLNNIAMGDALGLDQRTYESYKYGEVIMPTPYLIKLLVRFNVNPAFLLSNDNEVEFFNGDEYDELDYFSRIEEACIWLETNRKDFDSKSKNKAINRLAQSITQFTNE